MAVGFDSILFDVYPDGDGYLPAPAAPDGENAPRTYTATVRMTSGTDLATLRDTKSIVTVVPAMGFVAGGMVVVEAGIGSRSLVYPTADGSETTVDAILTGISYVGSMVGPDRRVELTFLLVE